MKTFELDTYDYKDPLGLIKSVHRYWKPFNDTYQEYVDSQFAGRAPLDLYEGKWWELNVNYGRLEKMIHDSISYHLDGPVNDHTDLIREKTIPAMKEHIVLYIAKHLTGYSDEVRDGDDFEICFDLIEYNQVNHMESTMNDCDSDNDVFVVALKAYLPERDIKNACDTLCSVIEAAMDDYWDTLLFGLVRRKYTHVNVIKWW